MIHESHKKKSLIYLKANATFILKYFDYKNENEKSIKKRCK